VFVVYLLIKTDQINLTYSLNQYVISLDYKFYPEPVDTCNLLCFKGKGPFVGNVGFGDFKVMLKI